MRTSALARWEPRHAWVAVAKPRCRRLFARSRSNRSGSVKIDGIAIRGAEHAIHRVVRREFNPLPLKRLGDMASGRLHRAQPAHRFFDDLRNQRRFALDALQDVPGCSNIAQRLFSSNASTVDMPPKNMMDRLRLISSLLEPLARRGADEARKQGVLVGFFDGTDRGVQQRVEFGDALRVRLRVCHDPR